MKSAEVQAQAEPTRFDRRAIPADAVEGRWVAPDGTFLRRIDWPDRQLARGSLLFLPGRGDAYEKYLESLDYWGHAGWRVTALEWRGQGGSGRLGTDAVTGHIDDFGTWVADLEAFWREWRAVTPGPHVVIGHSMGGHLVLRALAERRIEPAAAVLVAPMLGYAGPPMPGGLLHNAARLMCAVGDVRRPAWKWSEKPGQLPADRADLLTHDPERYADELWWRERRPELLMGPASWGWVERGFASMRGLDRRGVLEAIDVPVLVLATTADRLVSFRAIERSVRRLPRGELLRFGGEAYHEILREVDPVRNRALGEIDGFFARAAPAAAK